MSHQSARKRFLISMRSQSVIILTVLLGWFDPRLADCHFSLISAHRMVEAFLADDKTFMWSIVGSVTERSRGSTAGLSHIILEVAFASVMRVFYVAMCAPSQVASSCVITQN